MVKTPHLRYFDTITLSQSGMKISVARRLRVFLECEPKTEPHQWVRSGRSTHGGGLSESLFYFILTNKKFFDLESNANRHHAVLELGSGRGLFSIMASAISPKARTVIAVEVDPHRARRMEEWIDSIHFRDGVDIGGRYRVPTLFEGDFCGSTIRRLDRAIHGRRVMIYCNNAGQVWSGDIQTKLEIKLRDCQVGSIVISLDKFFSYDTSWREEKYKLFVHPDDVSWSGSSSLAVFKYTKVKHDGGGRRPRNTPFTMVRYRYAGSIKRTHTNN